MRITGGQAGGRFLKVPKGMAVRPTIDRVKQALFNSLGERVVNARVLELFAGSGALSQETLVKRCQLLAQRISMLYELNAPEFFDPALFSSFVDLLRRRGVLQVGPDNRLLFNEVLLSVASDAQLVLSEQIRHSILQVTHA